MRKTRGAETVTRDAEAYHGYLIRHGAVEGRWWVEKGGALCGWAVDRYDARAIIDTLVA